MTITNSRRMLATTILLTCATMPLMAYNTPATAIQSTEMETVVEVVTEATTETVAETVAEVAVAVPSENEAAAITNRDKDLWDLRQEELLEILTSQGYVAFIESKAMAQRNVSAAAITHQEEVTPVAEIPSEEETTMEDRNKEIYYVYKNGYAISVPAETQWIIRDFAREYNIDERLIFGCAIAESTFNPSAAGDSGTSLGLYQIKKFWITSANITHYTTDYASRNLFDPYDATLTLIEMWNYAIQSYGIDISTEQGMKDLLYWHNTGKYVKNVSWAYSNKIFGFMRELVEVV